MKHTFERSFAAFWRCTCLTVVNVNLSNTLQKFGLRAVTALMFFFLLITSVHEKGASSCGRGLSSGSFRWRRRTNGSNFCSWTLETEYGCRCLLFDGLHCLTQHLTTVQSYWYNMNHCGCNRVFLTQLTFVISDSLDVDQCVDAAVSQYRLCAFLVGLTLWYFHSINLQPVL